MNPLYMIPNDNPAVQAAIQHIKDVARTRGVELEVTQYEDTTFGLTFSGWKVYTTTFHGNGHFYTCVSGLLTVFSSVSIAEMETLNVIPKT